MQPPQMQFQHEKLDHNFVQFCTPSPKYCTPFPLALSAIKIWGAGDMRPPQMQFQHKKLDHNFVQFCTPTPKFCTLFPLALSAIQIWRAGDMQPPPICNVNIKNWIVILYSFCTILYIKFQILYTVPSCAMRNSNLGDVEMQPSEMQFQYKKLDHNFVLILYTFVHQVPNFVHPSFMPYPQFKFGGLVTYSPPNGSFNIKNWIIIFYSFCTILYTKSQILYILPPSDKRSSNFGVGVGDVHPPKCSFNIKAGS